MTLAAARALDVADPLAPIRDRFILPADTLYLDGNSLGCLPRATPAIVATMVERQWGERLIRGWNEGWIDAPARLGAKLAPLVGARAHEVIVGDSTSTNLFKLLVAALRHDPARRTIVSEAGNFPTDLHIAEGAVACVPGARLHVVARDQVEAALGEDTALLLLTHVHYKTAQRWDMAALTAAAHAAGALALWDLSHSVGAVPVALNACAADLAVGCGYKYLNGGPGSPAFLYVADHLHDALASPLSGWMGHAAPFAFEDAYRPAPGMTRWLSGTPPVLGMAALEVGLDLWTEVGIEAAWTKAQCLWTILAEAGRAAGLECVTPDDPARRGSHVSFRHPHAHAIVQCLIARGVIGDFRDPDIARFGLTPLYLSHEDVWRAGEALRDVMATGAWRDPTFARRATVT
jgi:kynureninase